MKRILRFLSPIVDAEDMKVIAVAVIVVLVLGLLLIVLGGLAALAVAAFEVASGLRWPSRRASTGTW